MPATWKRYFAPARTPGKNPVHTPSAPSSSNSSSATSLSWKHTNTRSAAGAQNLITTPSASRVAPIGVPGLMCSCEAVMPSG